jgi:hypothetical protein
MALWVAEPLEKPPDRDDRNAFLAVGTWLFLVEGYWNHDIPHRGPRSGLSALTVLLKELADAAGLDLSTRSSWTWTSSPFHVLECLGATVSEPRPIRSLYRKRYISDEQWVIVDGVEQRSWDLYAYPIFVAEA